MLARARGHFEQAVVLDATLSDAHSHLAFCSFWELVHRITKDGKQTLNSMLEHAHRAQALNPEDPLALGGIASYNMFKGDHATSRDYARQAIGFNPSYALYYWRLSLAQAHYGEFREAESNALKTFELSPVDPELGDFSPPDWRFTNEIPEQDFVAYASRWVQEGARLLGGCCGTTPSHISALRDALSDLQDLRRKR